jgi:hypothetical protein
MMAMLRRVPREVYRVYGEEEFFADAPYDKRMDVRQPGDSERRLQRLASVTVLLAAVGGLIVLAGVPSLTRGRRRGTRASAAAGRPLPARAGLWRERASSEVRGRRIVGERPALLTRSAPPAGKQQRVLAAPRPRGTATIDVAVPVGGAGPANAAAPVSVADATARASAVRPQQGRVEFGFER